MARTKYDSKFAEQFILFKKVKVKHDDDGVDSPLNLLLSSNQIDLDADLLVGEAAAINEADRLLYKDHSERDLEQGKLRTKPIFKLSKRMVQNLKSIFVDEHLQLLFWGAPILVSGKVKYSSSVADNILLFRKLKEKHESYGAGLSPLEAFVVKNGVDFGALETQMDEAVVYYKSADSWDKKAMNETELRIRGWKPVMKHVKIIYGFLKVIYSNQVRMLTEYGFIIIESKKEPSNRNSKVSILGKITKNGLVSGSKIKNNSSGPMHLFKGYRMNGKPIIIGAGKEFVIVRGYSRVTIYNPSKDKELLFSYTSFC